MNIFNKADEITRRRFVQSIAGTVLGVNTYNSLYAAAPQLNLKAKAKSVIYIFLSGGISQFDSFNIKPDIAEITGQTKAIKTSSDGIRISHFFPKVAEQMKHICLFNAMASTQGAHKEGVYFMRTSYTLRGAAEHPTLGAWISKTAGALSKTLPAYIRVGGSGSLGSGFFEARHGALPIADASSGLMYSKRHKEVGADMFEERISLLDKMNRSFHSRYDHKNIKAYSSAYSDAVNLMSSKDLDGFDISKENPKTAALYGKSQLGQGCLLARRLVEKGARFVEVNSNGWDHHSNIYDNFPAQAKELDQALATLIGDLNNKGLLDSTLVVLATEFGRSPEFSPNGGRSHHPAGFSCLMAGGGIKGGQAYGKTDKTGKGIVEGKVRVQDFNATIAHALGIPTKQEILVPGSKRPFKIADKGKPVTAVF